MLEFEDTMAQCLSHRLARSDWPNGPHLLNPYHGPGPFHSMSHSVHTNTTFFNQCTHTIGLLGGLNDLNIMSLENSVCHLTPSAYSLLLLAVFYLYRLPCQ